jgi:hypothetical protein
VVNTKNRGGSLLRKRFSVLTNDPKTAHQDLVVFGKVKGYVSVRPAFVRLMGRAGEDLRTTIQIAAEKDYPFKVKAFKAREGRNIQLDLKPMEPAAESKGYILSVRNTRTDPGVYRDFIEITTDLKEKPTIHIPVTGRIFEEGGKTGKNRHQ